MKIVLRKTTKKKNIEKFFEFEDEKSFEKKLKTLVPSYFLNNDYEVLGDIEELIPYFKDTFNEYSFEVLEDSIRLIVCPEDKKRFKKQVKRSNEYLYDKLCTKLEKKRGVEKVEYSKVSNEFQISHMGNEFVFKVGENDFDYIIINGKKEEEFRSIMEIIASMRKRVKPILARKVKEEDVDLS